MEKDLILDHILQECAKEYYEAKKVYSYSPKGNPIGEKIQTNDERIVKLYKKALSHNPEALYNLAFLFHKGVEIEKDDNKAFFCMNAAFFEGYVQAAGPLSECYYTGNGVVKDPEKAAALRYYGAANGNIMCAFVLAYQYEMGIGVEKNEEKAFQYYLQAAEGGFIQAQKEIVKRYQDGIGHKKDVTLAAQWQNELFKKEK